MSLTYFRDFIVPRHTLSYVVAVTVAAACLWILAAAALFTDRDGGTAPSGPILTSTVAAARNEYDNARGELRRARAEAAAANTELDEFLSRHFNEHRSAINELEANGGGRFAAEPAANAEPGLPSNFRREVLLRRLEELMIQRDRLREIVTPLHPSLQEIELQIAAINRRLAGTGESTPSKAPIPMRSDSQTLGQQQQAVADFDATREAAQRAELRVSEAMAAEQRAVERYAAANTRLSRSLRAASSQERASQPWALAVLGASLVTIGIAVASLAYEGRTTFSSLVSIKAVLGLPLVGVLSGARGGWANRRGPAGGAAVASLVAASELTVVVAACCAIAMLILDPVLLRQLFSDPLGAIADGVQQLRPAGP